MSRAPLAALRAGAGPILALTVLLTACGRQPEQPIDRLQDTLKQAEGTLEQLQRQSRELTDQIEQKTRRLQELSRREIDMIDRQMARFDEAVATLPAEREQALRTRLAELRQKRDAAVARLQAYLEAEQDPQGKLKSAFDAAMKDLQQAFDDFDQALQQARAPAAG